MVEKVGAGRGARGYTLVELMVGLTVAGVLATLAVPGFAGLRRSVEMSTAATELLSALHLARSSAVRAARPVAVCLSIDMRACIGGLDELARGWLVFHPEGSGALDPSPSTPESILQSYRLPPEITLRATRPSVTFWPVSRSGATGTFHLCPADGKSPGRAIVVSQTGRPRASAEGAACLA